MAADGWLAAKAALGVHVLTLLVILLIYECDLPPPLFNRGRAGRRARRADHAAIFGLIAGSYVPLSLLAVPRWVGVPVLVAAWLIALRGARLKMRLELGQDQFPQLDVCSSRLGRRDSACRGSFAMQGLGKPLPGLSSAVPRTAVGGLVLIRKSAESVATGHSVTTRSGIVAVLIGAVCHLGVSISLA